jgi:ATP-dependent helicase IRC3
VIRHQTEKVPHHAMITRSSWRCAVCCHRAAAGQALLLSQFQSGISRAPYSAAALANAADGPSTRLPHHGTGLVPAITPVSTGIQLRDYQEECIQAVLASLRAGKKRLGISLATGSGKTVIFTQLISRIPVPAHSRHATQTLILAHRRELVEQAARHCQAAYPDARVEIEMGSLRASGMADITAASVQSLTSGSGERLDKFEPARFKLVLVDEAHHVVAPGYLRVLGHFGLHTPKTPASNGDQLTKMDAARGLPPPVLVGVSATFSRFDGLRLGAAIDEIVYHKDYVSMIGDKWLSDVIFTTVESKADIRGVRSAANGDFVSSQLSRAVNTQEVNELTVRSWLARAGQDRKSTLVFCVDLDHVGGLTNTFRQHGVDARFVTGSTPKAERSLRLEEFKRRVFPVLLNCGVFTEGTDIPNIDCVLLARPTRSRNLLVQMIGRGMRLSVGKTNCHVIDMVGSLDTGVITTPTLFGLDPGEIISAAGVDELKALRERRNSDAKLVAEADIQSDKYEQESAASGPRSHSVSFTDYDSVLDLIADTSGERHIRTISQYAWVQVAPYKFILSGPTGTFLRLETDERSGDSADGAERRTMFVVWEVRALPQGISKSPYAAPRELLVALTLADAIHGADKYVSESEMFPHNFVAWRHRWRDGPPTQGQLDFLNKIRATTDDKRGGSHRGRGEELTMQNITKGRASDMITKIKHGARGCFADFEADRRRRMRQEAVLWQEKERAMRENVAVGPVPV